ncbi:Ig-like domain-containing protein [Pontixanthobacter gangjinensis]|uniref:Ig-like domain-containing protein n=1 Tax=Pontixanthobacter gangjinensis TaxID=1028742 RepID=UPI0019252C19
MLVLSAPAALAQSTEKENEYDSLGRLIVAETTNGPNAGDALSFCFDEAGNRIDLKSADNGTAANCAAPPPAPPPPPPAPPPPPPPPPPPSNNPPVANSDSATMFCDGISTVNLTANDTDPEGNYPLNLLAISGGGFATASVASSSSVSVDAGPVNGTTSFFYTVEDSLLASSTGSFTVTTVGCGGF